MKEKLTSIQESIYSYIAGYIEDNGYAPTYQEMAMETGLTTQAVESHLRNLVKKNWLKFNGKKFRKVDLYD